MNIRSNVNRAAKIAELNDKFRKEGYEFHFTRRVIDIANAYGCLRKVRNFSDFTEDNDPYGEHDYGSFNWYGERVVWKISYYDKNFVYYRDPLAIDCQRVMTVMLAEEY